MLDDLLSLISNDKIKGLSFELHLLSQSCPHDFLDRNKNHIRSKLLRFQTGVSDSQLIERYSSNGILVCPYSQRPEHESFVSQSFPSKLLKMVHTGLPCLILAPPYAAVCNTHGTVIPKFDPSGNISEFTEAIMKAEAEAPDLVSRIQEWHNPANFINRVFS